MNDQEQFHKKKSGFIKVLGFQNRFSLNFGERKFILKFSHIFFGILRENIDLGFWYSLPKPPHQKEINKYYRI